MLTRLVGFDEEAAKKPFVFDLPAQQKQLLIKIAETSSLVRFTPLSLLLCVHVCVCARVCVCVVCCVFARFVVSPNTYQWHFSVSCRSDANNHERVW